MSSKTIYTALINAGLTPEGACGLMGNMMAESTMKSNIAQRGMTKLSDETYTAAADNGLIDFTRDSVGYGLCQWTASSRKAALLAYAKSKRVSVGDEAMQVQFCLREMQENFNNVAWVLRTSHDIDECADRVCDKYEMPAINNYPARREYARKFYSEFCGGSALAQETPVASDACPIFPPDPSVMVIQMVMNYNGYWDKPDGQKTPEFFEALRTFVDDMEAC